MSDKAEELARERQEFEKWATATGLDAQHCGCAYNPSIHYKDTEIEPMWAAWQASAALLRPRLGERWIKASEQLPDDKQMVMGWFQDGMTNPIIVRYVGGREFHDFFKNWVVITHWRPLPAPPAEEDK